MIDNVDKKNSILILAAGSLKNKIHFLDYAFSSPALVPVNTRTAASNIIEFYQEKLPKSKIYLVINEHDEDEVRTHLKYYLQNVSLVKIGKSSGINETIAIVLNENNVSEDLIINPVTTIPTRIPEHNEVFLSIATYENADFSLVTPRSDTIEFFVKGTLPLEKSHAFTGLFRTSKAWMVDALSRSTTMTDLLEVVKVIEGKHGLKYQTVDWIDCGHEINFYESKAKLIASRSFNAIQIHSDKGILEKHSQNNKKFKEEVEFMQLLPHEIQVFFPRIIGSSFFEEHASAKIEYYGYPTMAEYMLYWNLSNGMWEKAFKALTQPLKQFKRHSFSIGMSAYKRFYEGKLLDRLDKFMHQLTDDRRYILKDDELTINNVCYKNFPLLKETISKRLEDLYDENDFCIMHGDYCFNNILYDHKSGIIRLIDARGSFGSECVGIYGDSKYDLAKLTHSIIGRYDYFIAKLFTLNIEDDNTINFSVHKRESHELLEHLNRKLIEELGYSVNDILFLTALLFLSMPPLHNEDPDRQVAFYVHGIVLLNQSLEIDT